MQREIQAKIKVEITIRNIVPEEILSLTNEDIMNSKIDQLVEDVQDFVVGDSPVELEIDEAYEEAENIYINGYYQSTGVEDYYPATRWEPAESDLRIDDDLYKLNEKALKEKFPAATSIDVEQYLDYDSIETI